MIEADIKLAIKELDANPLVKCRFEYVSLKLAGFETAAVDVHAGIDTCLSAPMIVPFDMVKSLALPVIGMAKESKPELRNTMPLLVLVEAHYARQKKIVPATVSDLGEEVMVGLNFLQLFGQKMTLCKASARSTDHEHVSY